MKKQIFFLLILVIPLSGFSQTWNLLGPDTANISRIDFAAAGQHHVLCADDGFYLYHYGNNTYEYFSNAGLSVTGAAYFDNEKILLTMGNGSYSDGIYTFDISTHEFEVIEYILWPSFLHYNEVSLDGYRVGSQWGGLWFSDDGITWNATVMFNAIPCLTMASLNQNLVVQVISDLTNSYWSDDGGENWYPTEIVPGFSKMAFHYDGDLLGVFPGYSNSSGLWKSVDQGNSWEIEIYQDNMSSVCYDVFSEIIVGFDGEGLGKYSPATGIIFFQNNPPNQYINNIQVNPTMSAPAIFVCTDEGVYYSYDYYVGVEEQNQPHPGIIISPNPADRHLEISANDEIGLLQVFDCRGKLILTKTTVPKNISLDLDGINAGIYFIVAKTKNRSAIRKFVKK